MLRGFEAPRGEADSTLACCLVKPGISPVASRGLSAPDAVVEVVRDSWAGVG